MNVVFAFAIATLIYFVGLPVPDSQPIIGKVDPASAEGKMGIREGDRVVMVDNKPIKTWDDVMEFTMLARTNVIPVIIEHGGVSNIYNLATTVSHALGLKTLNLDPREHPVVGGVESGKPAAAAGLQSGDKILSVNGIPVPGQDQMIELISKSEGKPCEIVFDRNNERKSVTVTPQYDPATKRARIGIGFSIGRLRGATPDAVGASQGCLRENGRHVQRAGALQTNRRWREGFGRPGGHSGHSRFAGEQRLPPRVELPRAAQHQPRVHQPAADPRARRRPHCHGHRRKNPPPPVEPQIRRIHHDLLLLCC